MVQPEKRKLISFNITTIAYNSFVENFIYLAKKNISSYVCVANVHMVAEAYQDSVFADVVNRADMVTPDGMPLAKGIQWLYGKHQDRVAGMDLLPDLLSKSEIDNIGVFFYGGTQEMLDKTAEFCKRNYPKLIVKGFISPPFRELSEEESESYMRIINDSGAGFVFVALGCPKQEKWMATMKGKINACMIGIGGALPVMIGMQKRAPQWMQNVGLEWFFRFCQEPKRLYKRYLTTNTLFVWLLTRELCKKKK